MSSVVKSLVAATIAPREWIGERQCIAYWITVRSASSSEKRGSRKEPTEVIA